TRPCITAGPNKTLQVTVSHLGVSVHDIRWP
ncbi:MAG: hypothetical protein QOF66_5648, partial [Mycobacterium sp.]|nr:hypothetical protein [Mycobacterium sp.]